MKPKTVNILGKNYKIGYYDTPGEVDPSKYQAYLGHIDFMMKEISIYDNGYNFEDVWHAIFHEILHAIAMELKLQFDDEDTVDLLALGLTDVMFRNKWIK
jgi:hypothetical protein